VISTFSKRYQCILKGFFYFIVLLELEGIFRIFFSQLNSPVCVNVAQAAFAGWLAFRFPSPGA